MLQHFGGLARSRFGRVLLAPAVDVLSRALPPRQSLSALALFYGTDKGTWNFGRAIRGHGYTRCYAEHISPRRSIRRILEIGVLGGASVRTWRAFFPHAEVIGIDIDEVRIRASRVTILQGSQNDREFLNRVAGRYGPFDLVIDDGSHVGTDIRTSFEVLFPHVRPGGWYVIEDLQTSYMANFRGGPVGAPDTGVALVKDLVDATQSRATAATHVTGKGTVATAALHVYPRIAFIERGNP